MILINLLACMCAFIISSFNFLKKKINLKKKFNFFYLFMYFLIFIYSILKKVLINLLACICAWFSMIRCHKLIYARMAFEGLKAS